MLEYTLAALPYSSGSTLGINNGIKRYIAAAISPYHHTGEKKKDRTTKIGLAMAVTLPNKAPI